MTTPILNGAFAKLLAGASVIGLADGDQTLSAAVYRGQEGKGLKHLAFFATGAANDGLSVFLPAVTHAAVWQGDPDNQATVTLRVGTGTVDLAPGQVLMVVTDGSSNGIM